MRRQGDIEVPLGVIAPGESFGESAILDGGVRTATVRASVDVEVYRLDVAVFNAKTV